MTHLAVTDQEYHRRKGARASARKARAAANERSSANRS